MLSVQAEVQIGEFCIAIGAAALTTFIILRLDDKSTQKWGQIEFCLQRQESQI